MAAEWALIAALSIHAYDVGGALAVGLLGLRFVPAAAVSLISPRLIERRQPAAILRAVAGGRALLIAAIAAGLISGVPYGVILALVAIDGALAALYRPAQSALLPSLAATPLELTTAAGLSGNVRTLSQVSGAFLGGVLVVVTSTQAVACIAAALMVTAAVLVPHRTARARVLSARARPQRSSPLRHSAANIAALASLRALVRGLWLAMVVVVSIRLIDLGAGGVGVMMAASAAGALLALPIGMRLFGTSRLAVGLGLALVTAGIPLAALAALHAPAIAFVFVAIHGTGMALAEATSLGLLHRLLDARGVASVVGPMESAKLGFEGAGSLLAPALLAVAGTRGALVVVGTVPVVLVALDWRSLGFIDATARERTRLVDLLRTVDVFRGLSMAAIEELAAGAQPREFAESAEVIRQGEPGDAFYIVETGEAEVILDGFPIATLQRGMGFGERALLRGGTRAATVRAAGGELSVIEVTSDVFLSAVTGGQRVVAEAQPVVQHSLAEVLRSLPLFARLPVETIARTAESLAVAEVGPDAVLVRQGEQGDRFFVLLSGRANVIVDGELAGQLIAGDGFGEIALLHDVPRRATVQACEPCRVATLDRDTFTEIVSPIGLPATA
jgi:CRP-like cAMP-binding protein